VNLNSARGLLWEVAFFVTRAIAVVENAMDDLYPMTRKGFDKLKAEVERLESVEMPAIAEKIGAARAEGDLKENAEYHAQREAQGLLQAKINLIRHKLSKAQIIDLSTLPRDEVAFGCTVTVKDPDLGDEEIYTLVGAGEENYDQGRILVTSPLGSGLLGKKIGQTAKIPAPKGSYELEVVSISYEYLEASME
jgi:transcription elongation factor GreA